ncbi:serine protease [Streptomyces sp. TLI_053]|uniref:hypothetical protein n=1 Tax=Streptomyces sp. TLI_053 TaxID=1855352 RepID=UPI000879E50F|nr:hypothetical protein [Streptomyces sp. TLI_053]SDS91882.1 serine protease [Streptomyces sp. TLI_053]
MRTRSAMAVAALTALVLTLPVTTASAAPAPAPGTAPAAVSAGTDGATAPAAFVPLRITRVLDTRNNQNWTRTWHPLAAGENFHVPIVSWRNHAPQYYAAVPADATAVVVNVTATNTTADGYLTVRRDAGLPGVPATSTLNFKAGETVSNTVTVALAPNGRYDTPEISVYNNAGTTDVVADVLGYYVPSTPERPAQKYDPVRPTRLADTRVEGGRLGWGSIVTADVAREELGTAGAKAVVLNVTAVDPSKEGFVVAYASGETLPNQGSNVSYGPGRTVANQVVVPVGADGKVKLFNTGSTDLVVDLVGFYGPSGHNLYSAVTDQTRLLDTRPGYGAWAFSTLEFPVAGVAGVPADATAATLNVTVTEPRADGHLEVFAADGAGRPGTSNLNFAAGQTVANGVTAQLGGAPGSVDIYHHSDGFTHVIADLTGYFVAG